MKKVTVAVLLLSNIVMYAMQNLSEWSKEDCWYPKVSFEVTDTRRTQISFAPMDSAIPVVIEYHSPLYTYEFTLKYCGGSRCLEWGSSTYHYLYKTTEFPVELTLEARDFYMKLMIFDQWLEVRKDWSKVIKVNDCYEKKASAGATIINIFNTIVPPVHPEHSAYRN